jgi:hypothetical protein
MVDTQFTRDRFSFHLMGVCVAEAQGRRGLTSSDLAAWKRDLEQLRRSGRAFFSMTRYVFVAYPA